MAGLSSSAIVGFISSGIKMGEKIVESFLSGFSGHGWKIWEYVKGKWKLEIDTIVVRETMLVFEMLISKIRAIIGAQAITQGHGKVKSARLSDDGTEYIIELEDEDVSIVAHDFIRCQTFVGDKTKLYHVEVSSVDVETKTLHVPLSEFDKDESGNVLNVPAAGDELIQFGNSQNKARQSAIYMHADETGQPAIDVMFDLNSKNWEGKVKVRVGGDIPGSGGLKGFYCVNGMIKGVDSKGNIAYCVYPDGTAELGCGTALFKPDKSGHIAGGAIEWIWDESNQKCVCTMKDVVLTWDNLSDDAKENLKGEKGDNGTQGIPGEPGKDGKVYYTWIRYADSSDGSGISNDPTGKKYMGLAYNRETSVESSTPSDYIWSQFRGEDGTNGVPGPAGSDGKTTYTWIAYSDYSDGHNMYQIPNDNTKYIGIAINKDTPTESNTPSDYTWSKFRGEDGEPGRDGINGADGVNGKDGVSLVYKGEFPSHPVNPVNGWYYRNTKDKKCYTYQDGAWYVMTVDGSDGKNGLDGVNGEDGKDGLDIVWKGDSSIPPANPQKNWAYRDTDNGRVYIYNGIGWALMVADGNDGKDGTNGLPGSDGKDGMRVYITYHDSEEEPAIPIGDGSSRGWHTNATASVVWISQKVAESADSGEWGDPIRIKGETGKDANLLPWIEKWNGYATELGEEYIVTPKMFSGTKSADGKLTGIAQGKDCLTDKDEKKRTGIFALVDNDIVFELDPINGRYIFRGRTFTPFGKSTVLTDSPNTIIFARELKTVTLPNYYEYDGTDCCIVSHSNSTAMIFIEGIMFARGARVARVLLGHSEMLFLKCANNLMPFNPENPRSAWFILNTSDFKAEWSDDLSGFILTGKTIGL